MSRGHINPTRMELMKLKNKLIMSKRGHKLLKDKQDELIHTFMEMVYDTRNLREQVDQLFSEVLVMFSALKEKKALVEIYEMLMISQTVLDIDYKHRNIMTVEIPKISINEVKSIDTQTFSDITSPIEIDSVKDKMNELFPLLIQLAEKEQSIYLMTEEISKTRRRVNVIENIMIPNLEEDIKRITMKLEDNERSNLVRVMKSKEIVLDKITKERANRNKNNENKDI